MELASCVDRRAVCGGAGVDRRGSFAQDQPGEGMGGIRDDRIRRGAHEAAVFHDPGRECAILEKEAAAGVDGRIFHHAHISDVRSSVETDREIVRKTAAGNKQPSSFADDHSVRNPAGENRKIPSVDNDRVMILLARTDIDYVSVYDQPVGGIRRRGLFSADRQGQDGIRKAERVGNVRDHDGPADGKRAERRAGRTRDRDCPVEAVRAFREDVEPGRLVRIDRDRERRCADDGSEIVDPRARAGSGPSQIEIHNRAGSGGDDASVQVDQSSGQFSAVGEIERAAVERGAVHGTA